MMLDLYKIAAAEVYGNVCWLDGKLWIPVKGFEGNLKTELALQADRPEGRIRHFSFEDFTDFKLNGTAVQSSRLVYCEGIQQELFWKQLCWKEPFLVRFRSIGEAAELLRGIQRNWAHYPLNCFRRAELIGKKLPYINKKEKLFPYTVPLTGMGVWSLLDEHTLLASAKTSSPFPLGVIRFIEDHQNPPSRAYLKLWEALTLLDFYYRRHVAEDCACSAEAASAEGIAASGYSTEQTAALAEQKRASVTSEDWALPHSGSSCVDAGACPGGWTWVLKNLGAQITAVDRTPLVNTLMQDSRITFVQHDVFTLNPEYFGKQDWVFSDVICYPPRLFEWIERWRASGLCSKFVCTIKMQGIPDFATIRRFAEIPHSRIVHLAANKHELTWLCAPFIDGN